jgi:hypothetical protein
LLVPFPLAAPSELIKNVSQTPKQSERAQIWNRLACSSARGSCGGGS